MSWIKSLGLATTNINEILDYDYKNLTKLVKTAWENWITYLYLWLNGLESLFEHDENRFKEFLNDIAFCRIKTITSWMVVKDLTDESDMANMRMLKYIEEIKTNWWVNFILA